MALARRFPLDHDDVFTHGAYLVSEVTAVIDFDKSTRETKVQKLDPDAGLPMWQVDVLDADPEATKKGRQVTVKIPAKHQPVPPERKGGVPFVPVEFDGLSALPYVDDSGPRPRIAWSFMASGMKAPGSGRPSGQAA